MSQEAWGSRVEGVLRERAVTDVGIAGGVLGLSFADPAGPEPVRVEVETPWQLERGGEVVLRFPAGADAPDVARLGWQEERALLAGQRVAARDDATDTGDVALTFANGVVVRTLPTPGAADTDRKWAIRQPPYALARCADGLWAWE